MPFTEYRAYLKNRNKIVNVTFEEIELSQFIGLCAKGNVPIYEKYENDIVEFSDKNYIVKYNKDCVSFIVYNEELKENLRFADKNNKKMLVVGNAFIK
jgi:yopX protein